MNPKQYNVLSVEDLENDRLLLQRAFRSLTQLHLSHCVTDGAEAITYLEGTGIYEDRKKYPFPDLMLLDIKMPVMNGFELLRWMKHQCWGRKPVVVLLTSSEETEDMEEGKALGADLYQVKPVTRDGWIQMMKDVEKFLVNHQKKASELQRV